MDVEVAPLDGHQGTHRYSDMGDMPPMIQEQEEGVVALGNNPKGVHTIQLINKPKTKKSKPKEFNNRMSPKGLRQLIEKLNDKQKEAVKEIGFGSFLYLRFRVIERDVYMALALPKGPLEVIEANNETNSSTEFETLLKQWREQWPERDGVPEFGEMVEMICSQLDGGEDLKRNFVLFVVSTCTNGNQRGAFKDLLDEIEVPDEAQEVHEEEPSNATPEPATEAEHDSTRSKIKALLEDAKKVSNEIITNSHVLAGVMTELEKLVPKAHASLKRVRMIAMQTTTDALFAEINLPGKSKSTTPVLAPALVS
ncbi:hypothetical protein Cgig2_015883 [Carnegiea gigantea]|uniref:Uncharacterized protein n=1 Tax=Carnegiea gigantea TaxID=171969 RepID=A0A9Q1GXF2_9CARY|nr:hypothetical protein Cgig2_015883 [Carnegiea gigantea]